MTSKVDQMESKEVVKQLWELYNVDDFIDAKDNQSDWRVGYIIEKNYNTRMYKVRFDGWGQKYDEYYRFTSPKLAPFRSIIIGYTGQKKNPGLRADWKFSLKAHAEKVEKFKEMCSSQTKTAWEINQFFRGHNYLYTDFLMTQTFQTLEQITAVMQYFLLNVKLVIGYLKAMDPEFKQYYRSQQVPEQSHLVDPHSAKVNCFYELMDTLYTISGSYARLQSFFVRNAALIRKYLNIDFEKNVRRYYQMRILQEVIKQDGLTVLEELIEKKLQNTKSVIPFLFLKSLSSLYIGLGNQIQYKEKRKYLNMLVQITKANLDKLDEKYLKEINKSHAVDLLDTLKSAFENTDDQQTVRNWALQTQVKLYQKMVICPYFDKKLKGVIGFQELAEKNKMQPYANHFITILVEGKIFDTLFSVDNAEIIRKAVEFCKFLYYNEMFPVNIAFRIWELREGKHEAALQQIYSLISIMPSKLHHSDFEKKLFEQISKQPKDQWDEDYIKMIKQFSLTAVGWASAEEKVQEKYGFDILFANVILKKSDEAIQSFIQLLTRFEKTEVMTEFITHCFIKIEANEDSYIYTILLLKIIDENLSQLKQASQKCSTVVIKDLLNNSNENLERNTKRFELLSQVTKLTSTNISFDEFMSLWAQFKNKPSEKAFYQWILSKKDGEKVSINLRIGSDIRKQIFQEIWSENYDFSNISEKEALLFVEFFKATNNSLGKLKKLNVIIKSETLDLLGFDRIWTAFENVHDQKIAATLADLIVEIHMYPAKSVEQKKQAWTKHLISLFSKKITEAYKLGDLVKVKRLLMIPSKIIDRDEEIFVAKPGKSYIMKEYKIVNKTTKEQKFIKFNLGGLTYDFKRTVAEKFKVPFKKCKLSCKGQVIKYENYFKSLVECSFSNFPFELEVIEEEAPSIKKCLNSQLETFFNLLGDPELQRNVWEIIEKLPIAEDELKKLETSEQPWEEINNPSIYKELYRMKVIGYMSRDWWKQFRKGPGLESLSGKFSRVTAKAKVERQYLKALCESVEKSLDIESSLKQINPEVFILNILNSLNDLLQNAASESSGKKHSVEVSIVTSIFNIFKKVSGEANFLKILVEKFEDRIGLLSKGLVTVKNEHIRTQFMVKLKQSSLKLNEENVQSYLRIIYKKIFDLATSCPNEEQTSQYFSYASELVDIVEPEEFIKFLKENDYQLTKLVERGLYAQKPEINTESVNYLLVGYLMLMKKLVKFSTAEERERITNFLVYKCFFTHLENKNSQLLCKGKHSKTAAFDLLASLLQENKSSLKAVQILSHLHKNARWRTRRLDDWTLTPGQKIKSASGYVGLKNLGCICYMNSLFQQIFMIPDFRQAILECDDPLENEVPTENVLYQVKKMFFSLLNSDTKYYSPNQFCHAFKNYNGQPTNVYEQMDIDEFSNVLFDKLENQIKGTSYENIIKDFFGGVFSNQIICKGCPHFSETEESFLSVSLNVKGKKNIYQSFDTMIKGDTLDGDNAYFCERCNKKVSAVKRVCLKKLPDHLILTLKRFEFDFETMNKVKLNDYCEFPTELNIKEYSQQYLRKQENPDRFDDDEALPDSYYDYTLQGVVIHIGHADSGHYFSYIKERKNEGRWFEFNDTIVRPFDIKKLAEEAFGGETGTIEVKERIKNAYMLIYERKKKLVDNSKLINPNRNLAEIPIYANLKQQIYEQNVIQKIQNILFSTEYTKFAGNLLKNIDKMEPETAVQVLKYVVQVYLTVIIRQKQEAPSFQFLKGLHKSLQNYSVVREWIATIFTAQKSLTEFFKNNPAKEVQKLLAHWVADIVKGVGNENKFLFVEGLIANIAISGENSISFCQILFELMSDRSVVQYAAKKHITGILLENVYGKQKPIFRNAQNFRVIQSAEAEIGKEIIIEKTPHELSKKIKHLQETPYVWGVLAKVIEEAEAEGLRIHQFITKQEVQLLYFINTKIYKILQECKSKFTIKKLCKILTHLAKNNQKFSDEIMNLGYMGLKEFLSKRYRQFFILLNRFAKIDDEFLELRTKKALESMVQALKYNQKYPSDSNIILQWIAKSVRKNNRFKSLILASPEWHKYLIEACTKKTPAEDVFRNNSIFSETTVNKFHGIKLLKSKKAFELQGKKLEAFFVGLSDQKELSANQWDSDDDLTEVNVEVGQTVAYFDYKDKLEFMEGKVEEALLSRLWISVNKTKTPGIWKDDQKLTAKNYPFQELQSDDEILDSENTTEMEYDDDLIPVI